MSEQFEHDAGSYVGIDRVPGEPIGEERTLRLEVRGYLLGLALAVALTAASFWAVGTHEIYRPGAAVALLVSDAMLRVKSCPTCGWFFLDVSKNRSRRWCSMDTCGAVAKARRYYRRLKERADR